jgi:2-polyprenyl-6-methoxyphenol hydroxylase-like FAD-dependent oxidoreductase
MRVDVAIVGASLAGCATAILLGRAGLRVALVDKHSGPDAYKRLCGHFIQASATPMIDRLGLAEPIEAAGGQRNGADLWTSWGLIGFPGAIDERPYGYSIRRSTLDPLIREIALTTPGVSYLPGYRAMGLLGALGGSQSGVEIRNRKGEQLRVGARLVIGADGRNSTVARLAGAGERRSPNTRFCYATYFTGVGMPEGSGGRLWVVDHDFAIAAPNDDGLTLLGVFLDKRRLGEFKADRVRVLRDFFTSLPESPVMAEAECEDPVLGYTDYDLIVRDAAPRSNVALVGDAGLTSDPAMAIGCGWALQSAGWLADALAPALVEGRPLAPALRRYRRQRRRHLYGHHRLIAFDARVRRTNAFQRLLVAAAASDPSLGAMMLDLGQRSIPARRLFAPSTIIRTGRVSLAKKAPGSRLPAPDRMA